MTTGTLLYYDGEKIIGSRENMPLNRVYLLNGDDNEKKSACVKRRYD